MPVLLNIRHILLVLPVVAVTNSAFAQKNPAAQTSNPAKQSARITEGPPHILKLISEGDQLQSQKSLRKAQEKYFEAFEKIEPAHPALQIEAALKSAQVASRLPPNEARLDATAKLLETASRQGTPYDQARVGVFSADIAMRQGQPKKAIEILDATDWNQLDKSQQPILKYNLGRAYDLDNQPSKALVRYGDALTLNPQFGKAADRAVEAAWKVILSDPPGAREASRRLMQLGLANRTAQFSLQLIAKPGNPRERDAALTLLFRSWAATYPGPAAFVEGESFLQFTKTDERSGEPAIRELVQGVLEMKSSSPFEISSRLRWFAEQDPEVQAACSAFAVAIGKWLIAPARQEPQYNQAMVRFMVAWNLDRENIEAAIELARVLNLDLPGGNPKLVDTIVARVFEEKSGLFFASDKDVHQWSKLETFHTFLGMIYEKRGTWGNPSNAQSALFQWEHALIAHASALKLDPELPPAPGLHEHLAIAWSGADNNELAYDQYLLAVAEYLKHDDQVGARQALAEAKKMNYKPTPVQQRRAEELAGRLAPSE